MNTWTMGGVAYLLAMNYIDLVPEETWGRYLLGGIFTAGAVILWAMSPFVDD